MRYQTGLQEEAFQTAAQRAAEQETEACRNGYNVISLSTPDSAGERMASDVLAGLTAAPQKTLPCAYFYDSVGSLLFERITQLPEYYLTRTEAEILRQAAPDLRRLTETALGEPPEIVEFGSGSAEKTRLILNEWQQSAQVLTYMPVDINGEQLAESARQLCREYPRLNVLGLSGRYEDALDFLPLQRERLFLFLGASIGNFSEAEQATFFRRLKEKMGDGSRLLLGYDIAPHGRKTVALTEAAYNDRLGLTAEFDLNLLTRLNRELGANFDLARWRHRADFNERESRIEMRLESQCEQRVHLAALNRDFDFAAGETLLSEIARKFKPDDLTGWFGRLGYQTVKHWQDSTGWYGLLLLQS